MHIEELEMFLTLAKTLHFQKASALQNISPSALSRSIQRLETQVGETLFERSSRAVALTPAGRIFRTYAEQIIKTWKDGRQALSRDKGVIAGELGIYCSVTAAYGILPDILDGFRNTYPHVNIKLRTGDAESALEQLQDTDTDIAIAAIPGSMPDHMVHMKVTQTPLVWIRAIDRPFQAGIRQSIDTIDWETTPLILPKQGIARTRFDRWKTKHSIRPNIYAQVTGNEAIIAMVHLGFGIGLVPGMVLDKSPVSSTISVIEIDPPLTPYVIGICVNRKRLENPVVKAFWDAAGGYTRNH